MLFLSFCGWLLLCSSFIEKNLELEPACSDRRPDREDPRCKKIKIHFLWTVSFFSAAQAKNF
jgi:hypothetical protein